MKKATNENSRESFEENVLGLYFRKRRREASAAEEKKGLGSPLERGRMEKPKAKTNVCGARRV